jgi:hypothetical protein
MKLCGRVQTIEEIEKVIKEKNHAQLGKGNHGKKVQGKEFKPMVFHRTYWLKVKPFAFAVKMKLTFDYRDYDYKDNVSEVEVRDDKVWVLVANNPRLAELFCNLTPFYTRSQYYAHKHRGSPFLRAMDKVLE